MATIGLQPAMKKKLLKLLSSLILTFLIFPILSANNYAQAADSCGFGVDILGDLDLGNSDPIRPHIFGTQALTNYEFIVKNSVGSEIFSFSAHSPADDTTLQTTVSKSVFPTAGIYKFFGLNSETGEECGGSPITLTLTDTGSGSGSGSGSSDVIDKPLINTGSAGDTKSVAVDFATTFLNFGIGIAGGIAFLLMIFGAYRLIFAAGNPEATQQGREIITAAIVGLLVIISAVFILNFLGFTILGVGGLV